MTDRANAFVDGHMHQLTAAQDVVHDPITDSDITTALGEVGAAKGTRENPDTYLLSKHGVAPRNMPGDVQHGLTLIWRKKGDHLDSYPVAGFERAKSLFDAIYLWEALEQTGKRKEYHDTILDSSKISDTRLQFHPKKSSARKKDSAASGEGKSPLYKSLSHTIESKLPIIIQFFGNLRFGSSSLDREGLSSILNTIEDNPWAYAFLTRRLVNQYVSQSKIGKKRFKVSDNYFHH
jgi:hypothetical protein